MKKALLTGLVGVIGAIIGGSVMGLLESKSLDRLAEKVDKFKGYYNILNQWIVLKQEGKTLERYFIDHGYKTIAIYGMGEMGNRLYDELKNTSIKVKYAIDKNAEGTYSELKVIDIEDEYEDVDVIVVTATFAFEEISEQLKNKINFPIVSLDDVVYES